MQARAGLTLGLGLVSAGICCIHFHWRRFRGVNPLLSLAISRTDRSHD